MMVVVVVIVLVAMTKGGIGVSGGDNDDVNEGCGSSCDSILGSILSFVVLN